MKKLLKFRNTHESETIISNKMQLGVHFVIVQPNYTVKLAIYRILHSKLRG